MLGDIFGITVLIVLGVGLLYVLYKSYKGEM